MWRLLAIGLLAAGLGGCTTHGTNDASMLRAHHATILEAHRTGDIEPWLALEADTVVTASQGAISFPDRATRRAAREQYLERTAFTTYADLRPPIIQVSDDGTLGWVLATVEVSGTTIDPESGPRALADVWAWIELYRKVGREWRLVGNLSSRQPIST